MNKKSPHIISKKQKKRLLKPIEFDFVFSNPTYRLSNSYILLLARETQDSYVRLGLVVAKKKIPKAINRNRFKRLAREYFRKEQINISHLDIVVLSRNDISTLPPKEQNKNFEEIFTKLKKIHKTEER